MGFELMAVAGSETARNLLKKSGDQNYEGYEKAFAKASEFFPGSAGLLSEQFEVLRYWLTRGNSVLSEADDKRRLNTCLAFWTRSRHANILYAKQSYTPVGKGLNFGKPEAPAAWLEPAPELYLYLKDQAGTILSMLRTVEPEADDEDIIRAQHATQELVGVLKKCRKIASAEIAGVSPCKADSAFLNDLDNKLSKLTGGKDSPVVVDVHTEANSGKVLQEALGYPKVVEKKVGDSMTRGALFTYYEFKHPMDDRLTDERWGQMLANPQALQKLELSPAISLLD